MSDQRHEDMRYNERILALSDAGTGRGRLDRPHGTASADNPYCADHVSVDVTVRDGAVTALAHRVRGCILCEAVASVIGAAAVGRSAEDLGQVYTELFHMLAAEGPAPGGAWADLEAFVAVRPHRSRHDCVLLPFEALLEALEQANRRR